MVNQTNSTKKNVKPRSSIKNELTKLTSIEQRRTEENRNINNNIILTNLDHIPLMKNRYVNLGYINYCLIKETTDTKEGGVENFLTTFIEEAICIFKNYAAGLGAEAIISFKIDELKILNYPKRNQAESLIYLSGNAIKLKIID
uniref:C2 domain-containing protein 5 (Trinotate prediction) n=1 Tax=Henneguya salminicola TaxID=69463 RepID=A0A6G3MJC8_HENSL